MFDEDSFEDSGQMKGNKDINLPMQANHLHNYFKNDITRGVESCQAVLLKKLSKDKDEKYSTRVRLRELWFYKFFFDSIRKMLSAL